MVTSKSFRSIKLSWDSFPISRKYDQFKRDLEAHWQDEGDCHGIYLFEGKHDGHRAGTILYIGMTRRAEGERPLESAGARLFRTEAPKIMYGSFSDLTFRWAKVDADDPDLTKAIESLLIASMKPVLNSQEMNSPLPESAWDLVVSNNHDKGSLLPMLHGDYFEHRK